MWGSLGVEGYGRLSTGEIDNLTDVTDAIDPYIGRIIQYSTPYNIGSSWRYGTSLNATFRPSGFFNLRLYANVYDYGYSMQYDKLGQEAYEDSKWSYSIRLNMWTKVWLSLVSDWLRLSVGIRFRTEPRCPTIRIGTM